jgi:hypothetical protein
MSRKPKMDMGQINEKIGADTLWLGRDDAVMLIL